MYQKHASKFCYLGFIYYAVLQEHCDTRVTLLKTIKKLPGRKAKEVLLSLNPHPADRFV